MNLNIIEELKNLGISRLQKAIASPEFFDSLSHVTGTSATKSDYAKIFFDYMHFDLLNDKDLRFDLIRNNIKIVNSLVVGTRLEDSSNERDKLDLILDTKWGDNIISKNWLKIFNLSDDYLPKPKISKSSTCVLEAVKSLYPYQKNLKDNIISCLLSDKSRLLIHMPTGAGKTRTTIEALVDFWRIKGKSKNFLIWLADSEELCGQAEETFRDLWQLKGDRNINLYRLWGSNNVKDIRAGGGIIIASLQKLYNMMKSSSNSIVNDLNYISGNSQLVVVDEAHKSMAETYSIAIERICVFNQTKLIGLTATPGRTSIDEIEGLVNFYNRNKITLCDENGEEVPNAIQFLQDNQYLSQFERKVVKSNTDLDITPDEERKITELLQIPTNLLKRISSDEKRNILIINEIEKLVKDDMQIMVFACSVEHAKFISTALNIKGVKSCSIDGATPSANRANYINKFKSNDIQVLVNFGILSTGFDAPNTNAVVIARPTCSLVLYSQMVGRGLRGPKMGGTNTCKIIDIKDNFEEFNSVHNAFRFYDDFWN
jgi:superfamily II DNA or RNA helicase